MKKSPANPWKKRARIAGVAVAFYTVTGFLIVPAVIKWQIRKQLPALTHRQVAVETVRVNPFALSLTIRGLQLTEPDGTPFASVDEFYGNFETISLIRWRWQFREVRLVAPSISLVIGPDGSPNIANLIPPSTNTASTTTAPELTALPRVVVGTISITNGRVDVADHALPKPFQHRFDPINITLHDFSTLPERERPYSFTAETSKGETFEWVGDLSINPIRSEGTLSCRNIALQHYAPFLPSTAQVRINSGRLNVDGAYTLDLDKAISLAVTNVAVQIRDLKVTDQVTGKPMIELTDYAVRDTSANLLTRIVRLGSVAASNGVAYVERKSDGTTNLQDLGDLSPILRLMEGWTVDLDDFRIQDVTLHVADAHLPHQATLTLDQIGVHLQHISNYTNTLIPVAVSCRWNRAGSIRVDGKATLLPVTAEMDLRVEDFDLRPLQPYTEPFANVALTNGAVRLKGRVIFNPKAEDGQVIRFEGETGIARLATRDTILNRPLLNLEDLALTGIRAAVPSMRVHVDKIAVAGVEANVVRDKEERINVLHLLKSSPSSADAAPTATNAVAAVASSPPAPVPEITVNEVVLDNVVLRMADESVKPAFHSAVHDVTGTIKGLSSKQLARADVDLRGRVNNSQPFTISGAINPLTTNIFTDLKFQLQDMALVAGSPYAGKYAGYGIEGGTVTLDLQYRVSQAELNAENKILVDNLQFGSATGSPDATKLPVKLGIALLTDAKGRITLDVPIRGSLNDPEFRIGRVILQVLSNLIVQAATSPFNLLGSIIGSDAPDLTHIAFQPGTVTLTDAEEKKFTLLTKVLTERPALKVHVTGTIDPEADRNAVARDKLLLALKKARLTEQPIQRMQGVTADQVVLDRSNYERLLRNHYATVTGEVRTANRPAHLRSVPVPKRPARNAETVAEPTLEEMERHLMAGIVVTPEELEILRQQRAQVVVDRLTQNDPALAARVVIAPEAGPDADLPVKPRAALRLDI